ncbi:MAG: DUF362 domain-containing protein [Candidatus Latescibacterota bacterium]|jgi:uncharacterized protein (DUF362 family)
MKTTGNRVYLYRTEVDTVEVPFERYELLGYEAMSRTEVSLPAEGTILLKPNITIPVEPQTRIITHPGFIVGLLRALMAKGVDRERLVVAEVVNGRSEEEWARITGYAEALAPLGMKVTGLTALEGVRVEVPGAVVFDRGLVLFREVTECAFFINVPVAKCHNLSCTTFSTKNLQGTVVSPQRHMCGVQEEDKALGDELARVNGSGLSLHEERFCHKHADAVSAIRVVGMPRLNIIDGMVGRDGTAFREGQNHPLGWTLIGENETHVDAVGTYLFGLDPTATPYLRTASDRGLGANRVDRIEVVDLATGSILGPDDLRSLRADPPLIPLSRYSGGYYSRFRADGTVVPWSLDHVNERRVKDGLEPIPAN